MKLRRAAANWQFRPSRGQLRPQALGVADAFNYPLMTGLSPAIDALAAGKWVIIKPSDQMQATTGLLRSLFGQAFSPCCITGRSKTAAQVDSEGSGF